MRGKWRSSHEGPPRRSLSKQLNRAGAGNIPMPEGRRLESCGGTGIRTDTGQSVLGGSEVQEAVQQELSAMWLQRG